MMKHEFEEIIGGKVTDAEWEKIEMVHMWYEEGASKSDIIALYKTFGIKIFNDCYPRAKMIAELKGQLASIDKLICNLANGAANPDDQPIQYWPTEKSGMVE
ncbi:MAG: hypothetical protein K6U74_14045 [Firmicutes bacterium]|nr:hypothetical protein [Bacillota bacterium]